MILDLAAPKVVVPATLFMIASVNDQTRPLAFLIVPILSWVIIKFGLRFTVTQADLIVPGVISGLLTLLPLPTDLAASIVIKGLIFLFVFAQLRVTFPKYY